MMEYELSGHYDTDERSAHFRTQYLSMSRFPKEVDYIELWKSLEDMGFFTAPASTKYHGNYAGGLYDHCHNVAMNLMELTRKHNIVWERSESPYIVGLFHDLCKCDQYVKTDDGYAYNDKTLLKGHGDKSVMLLSTLMQLTEEEMLCIRYHMGAFTTDKEEWGRYTDAIHKYQTVLWTHTADMMAAHIQEVG